MEPIITIERLLSFDSDYEPSGLMTPRDRAEIERRKAERRVAEEATVEGAEETHNAEKTAVAAN